MRLITQLQIKWHCLSVVVCFVCNFNLLVHIKVLHFIQFYDLMFCSRNWQQGNNRAIWLQNHRCYSHKITITTVNVQISLFLLYSFYMILIYVILFQKIDLEPISNKSHYGYIRLFYHSGFIELRLTHISLASFLWDIGKQCKIRTDAAKRGV